MCFMEMCECVGKNRYNNIFFLFIIIIGVTLALIKDLIYIFIHVVERFDLPFVWYMLGSCWGIYSILYILVHWASQKKLAWRTYRPTPVVINCVCVVTC